jgi:uncharacterized membrane protein
MRSLADDASKRGCPRHKMQDEKPDRQRPDPAKVDIKGGLQRLAEPAEKPGLHIGARLRNNFLTGLVIVGPVTITIYIVWWFINAVDAWVKPFVPRIYLPDTYLPFAIPGIGLLFAIIGLTMIGALAANLIGRSLISAGEMFVERMPIVRNVYRALKQIFESVVTAAGPDQAFQKVAVMEFPSAGIWSLVFITGPATREIAAAATGEDLIAVFMPTHLMPPSGFTVFVPKSRVVPIDMTFEDAAKIILSAGMATPDTQAKLKAAAERAKNGPRKVRKAAPTDA